MASQQVTLSSATASTIIPIGTQFNVLPGHWPVFNGLVGLICTISPGASLTYSVQVTGDQTPSPGGNWNNHDVLINQTASANDSLAVPVTGVRLNVTSYSSGSVTLNVVQP